MASHNNNNSGGGGGGGEKYNPFRNNLQEEESPWQNELTTPHSPFNPFANQPQQQQNLIGDMDTASIQQQYSPSSGLISTNDLIDLQQANSGGGPQSLAQAAGATSSLRQVHPATNFGAASSSEPSTISSAHFRNTGKKKGEAR